MSVSSKKVTRAQMKKACSLATCRPGESSPVTVINLAIFESSRAPPEKFSEGN